MKKKKVLVKEIVDFLDSAVRDVIGYKDGIFVDNLSDIHNTESTTLDWVNPTHKKKAQSIAESSKARTILVDKSVEYSETLRNQEKCLIVVDNPKYAIALIGINFFLQKEKPSIHPTAIVSPKASIGDDVYIGPYTIIGESIIGQGTIIGSNVRILDGCRIGSFCKISDQVVLGEEGFGFEKDENGNWFRFPQIGGVQIGDYVEIGPFTAIDRGALSDTIIGSHSKLDSHVKIAHNNIIGSNVIITAGVVVAGSNVIEDNVWIAPNSSLVEWGHIGTGSFVGIGSVVTRKFKENVRVLGNPAKVLKI